MSSQSPDASRSRGSPRSRAKTASAKTLVFACARCSFASLDPSFGAGRARTAATATLLSTSSPAQRQRRASGDRARPALGRPSSRFKRRRFSSACMHGGTGRSRRTPTVGPPARRDARRRHRRGSVERLGRVREVLTDRLAEHQRFVVIALALNEGPIDVLAERLGTKRGALYRTLREARLAIRADSPNRRRSAEQIRRLSDTGAAVGRDAIRGGERCDLTDHGRRQVEATGQRDDSRRLQRVGRAADRRLLGRRDAMDPPDWMVGRAPAFVAQLERTRAAADRVVASPEPLRERRGVEAGVQPEYRVLARGPRLSGARRRRRRRRGEAELTAAPTDGLGCAHENTIRLQRRRPCPRQADEERVVGGGPPAGVVGDAEPARPRSDACRRPPGSAREIAAQVIPSA